MTQPKTQSGNSEKQPLQKFHVTIIKTIARTYELEADSQSTATMCVIGYDHNPDILPKSVEILGQDIEVDPIA